MNTTKKIGASSCLNCLNRELPLSETNTNIDLESYQKVFNNVLSRLIIKSKITEEQARCRAGISLHRYKNCNTMPSNKTLMKICELLGISIFEFNELLRVEAKKGLVLKNI